METALQLNSYHIIKLVPREPQDPLVGGGRISLARVVYLVCGLQRVGFQRSYKNVTVVSGGGGGGVEKASQF